MKKWTIPSDPFISHMRIAYEENVRNSTEEYWRKKITDEIRSIEIEPNNNVDILLSNERLKRIIIDAIQNA